VKLAALVVDHAVIAVRQSPQRNGGPFDVLEESLERLSVACRYPARRVEIETRVLPALKELHTLGGDGLAFEHHLESALTEEFLERAEVEIMGSGVERALLVEDAERTEGMEVRVGIEKISERLRRDDHRRDRLFYWSKSAPRKTRVWRRMRPLRARRRVRARRESACGASSGSSKPFAGKERPARLP